MTADLPHIYDIVGQWAAATPAGTAVSFGDRCWSWRELDDRVRRAAGEFWVRSEQAMAGYWNQPEATTATITADGWLRTGDLGYIDATGTCSSRTGSRT